jgi:hypothetical protein
MYAAKLLPGSKSIHAWLVNARVHLLHEACNTNFVEFIKIRIDKRQKPQALKKWVLFGLSLLEDATVKSKPTELSIEVGNFVALLLNALSHCGFSR